MTSLEVPIAVPARPQAAPRVTSARTVEEVDALRPYWPDAATIDIDAAPDWLLAVVEHLPHASAPHVLRIERADGGDLFVIARLEHAPLDAKLGPLRIRHPKVRRLAVAFGGVAGVEDERDAAVVVDALRAALRDGVADVAVLTHLDVGAPLARAVGSRGPRLLTDLRPRTNVHWQADVPDTLAGFLAARSKNTRDNVKRYAKKLEKAHGAGLAVREFRAEDELDALLAQMEPVAAKTYQRAMGVGFTGDALERRLMRDAARRDQLRAWVLTLDGAPIAFWYGYAYGGRFTIGSPGFDPAYGDLRVGQYLQMKMMESLCADPAVSVIDYGTGDAQYKRSFGDECREQVDVGLYAPRPRAVLANVVRALVGVADGWARRLADKAGKTEELRRRWRERGR